MNMSTFRSNEDAKVQDWFRPRQWTLARGKYLTLGPRAIIMGILNVTPDSFSDGGKYPEVETAMHAALSMRDQGAQIIDIGGESTRPGAKPVSPTEEQDRILPVIENLAKEDVLISVDTYRASTAKLAVEAGAHIINDVSGFQKDKDMPVIAAKAGVGCCAMHTGRDRQKHSHPFEDQINFLGHSLEIMLDAGISPSSIVLDPGFGFAKDTKENLHLLARFQKLHRFGYPLLAGTSRKRFIGTVTGRDATDRDVGTAATSVLARMKGAAVFRVHNVSANLDALRVVDALLAVEGGNEHVHL